MRAIRLGLMTAAVLAAASAAVRAMPIEDGGWNNPSVHRRPWSARQARVFCPPLRRPHPVRHFRYGPAEPAWIRTAPEPVVGRRDPAVFPVCTTAGLCGPEVIVAEPRPTIVLPLSPTTGQPLTVVYNSPGSYPGAVDPYVVIVPLPHVRRAPLQGTYPSTY